MFGTDLLSGTPVATLFVGIVTILLIYWYSVKNHGYWKERGIPYNKPYPFIGSFSQVFTKTFHEIVLEDYRRLGRMFGHFEGSRPMLSVADPSLLRDIFVKDFQVFNGRRTLKVGDSVWDSTLTVLEGDDWKRVRSIVSPTFSTGKLKRVLGIFKDCSRTLVENFKKAVEEGKPIEVKSVYGAFTMDIIASSAFSTKIDSHNDPENKFVQTAKTFFVSSFSLRILGFIMVPRLMKFLGMTMFSTDAMHTFKELTYQIIEERKRTGQVRNDFLQLLLESAAEIKQEQKITADKEKEDITSNYGEVDDGHQTFKTTHSKTLSMDELVAQCVAFFLAGFDTTSTTLSIATYLLALHPEIQNKLRSEVDRAIKENKGELTYEAVRDMKYLDNVISETLRLYPPSLRTERLADTEYKLGDTGLILPKGMIVTIPIYGMHRDPDFFPNPEVFDPDRKGKESVNLTFYGKSGNILLLWGNNWISFDEITSSGNFKFTVEERTKRNQYTFIPFGAGPRNCVAMRFALLEIKVCLAHVVSTFIIKRCPQTMVPLEFHKGQVLLQPKKIFLEMELREDYRPIT